MTEKEGISPRPFVEIEALFASKNSAVLKFLPGFVLRYLKRVIHQDALNEAMNRLSGLRGLAFIDQILKEFGLDIQVKGIENLPAGQRLLIASNHPLGGLDGLALMQVAGRVNPDLVFPVNDLLMGVPNIRELFIPVNKHGSNAQNIKIIDETFASSKTILYFPAGLCSRKQGGKILDLEWKKTFITRARRYQRDVLPVFIDGRNSDFFYNLANLRKWLGLKANIEMLYLVDEMFKQRDKRVTIHMGKPIAYGLFGKEFTDTEWASLVKGHVYRIGSGIDDFQGHLQDYRQQKDIATRKRFARK